MSRPPIRRSISRVKRAFDTSISGLLEAIRILFLLSPFLLSLSQIAKAETATASIETSGYEDITSDDVLAPFTLNPSAIATFGPFSVVNRSVAELNGVIDQSTPDQVHRMLVAFPGISLIRMIDCPGTENDDANLEVARMIRRAGISTFVPSGGSVRSGGVELFLAGIHRTAEPGAEFGVHSWEDEDGRQARDVPAGDPAHLTYLRYYEDVGLSPEQARAFYAFTNQASFDSIHYMTQRELALFHITN
jgi:hypothetical protein